MTTPIDDYQVREHVGIAIDGGGIKGVIVAHAIIELERILGVDRLIESPKIKVIAGTSTGALIAFGVAAGMKGEELVALYERLGETIFSKPGKLRPFGINIPFVSGRQVSRRFASFIEAIPFGIGDLLSYMLFPVRYSTDPLHAAILKTLAERPAEFRPNDNPTLRELGRHLETNFHAPTLIFTATEVTARRTHFLKTSAKERFQDMLVADAVIASSAIPTFWEPVPLPTDEDPPRLLVDGGVGSFGNPAFVAAWELVAQANYDERRRYAPQDATVFSFGTGTLSRQTYRKTFGNPEQWWALDWSSRALDIFSDSAVREQSRNIMFSYEGIDLRRFQVELSESIGADRFDLVNTALRDYGTEMRRLLRENRHALNIDPDLRNDPEGIWNDMLKNYLPSFGK